MLETDGYQLDRFKTFYAGEYGVLTFVEDHALIENCDAWGSGDSGLYPGAPRRPRRGASRLDQRRYGTEIRNCDMHHNLLGYSGTDGNAVWLHDNNFYDNALGFSTDVFTAPGHPGFPQDSDLLEHNNFYDNNFNPYLPECAPDQKPGPSGPNQGCSDVTPTEPVPVGTGMWIAGGNANVVRNNHFYDNWRRGVMLFAVPDAFVCDDPDNQVAGCNPTPTVAGTPPPPTATSSSTTRWDRHRTGAPRRTASTSGGTRAGSSSTPLPATPAATAGTATPAPTAPPRASRACPSPSGAAPDNLPSELREQPARPAPSTGRSGELLTCSVTEGDPSCPWFTTPPKP